MPETLARLTFDEAMADWAEAELASPYTSEFGFSYLDVNLRERIANTGLASLNAKERQLACAAILHFRQPLLRAYQVNRSADFTRCRLGRDDVAALAVIPEIAAGSSSLAQIAERLKEGDHPDVVEVRKLVARIADEARQGRTPVGHPFIVAGSDGGPYVLIEGYKRTLAWLIHGRSAWLEVILVRPAVID